MKRGQATLEYILVLFIVVMTFLILKNTLGPLMRAAGRNLQKGIESQIAPKDFHSFPLKQ